MKHRVSGPVDQRPIIACFDFHHPASDEKEAQEVAAGDLLRKQLSFLKVGTMFTAYNASQAPDNSSN